MNRCIFLITIWLHLFSLNVYGTKFQFESIGLACGFPPPPEPPSHRFLKSDLELEINPEKAISKRLGFSKELKTIIEQNQKEKLNNHIKDLVNRLLRDPDFLSSLQKNYRVEEIEKMIGHLQDSANLKQPYESIEILNEVKRKSKFNSKELNQLKEIKNELLQIKKMNESINKKFFDPDISIKEKKINNNKISQQIDEIFNISSNLGNLDFASHDWVKKQAGALALFLQAWVQSPNNKNIQDFLNNLHINVKKTGKAPNLLFDNIVRVARFLPRLSPPIPKSTSNRIPIVTTPFFDTSEIKEFLLSSDRVKSNSAGILLLLSFAICLFLISTRASQGFIIKRRKETFISNNNGMFPSRPVKITTRNDLVKAFDYFSFHLLGPDVVTNNHLEIARKIELSFSFDLESKGEAIKFLTQLYEQARYAPQNDHFPDEVLRRASLEISYLEKINL